jgi:tetratricopeptide (TPR) repeat protein
LHHQYADWLAAQGRLEEALAASSKAVELDPLVPIFLNGKANQLGNQGRIEEAIEIREAAYALAPELQMTTINLFRTYIAAGRLDEAEKLLDETRASALARVARDPAWDPEKDVQRIARAWIRLLRDPSQAQAIATELDEQDYARLQDLIADDIDTKFKQIEAALEKHVNGVDPVGQLRSVRFADHRKDPRYIRLLNKAGFDDEGNIR